MAQIIIKASAKAVIGWLVLATALFAAVVLFMYSRGFEPAGLWVLLLIPVSIDIWACGRLVRLNSRRLVVGEGVLRLEDGLVSKKECNLLMDKVRDVHVEQSGWQRVIGVGNLSVVAMGDDGHVRMEDVDRPREAAQLILAAIGKNRR